MAAPIAPAPATAAHDAGTAAPDPTVAMRLLDSLGKRVMAELDATYPTLDASRDDGIPALGPCTRPTPAEREAITRTIIAQRRAGQPKECTWGCSQRAWCTSAAAA